jgi:plasmid stabilization system protein ParE
VKIRITSAAESDITSALDWYHGQNPLVGAKFLEAVAACISSIREHPLGYQQVYRDCRKALLHRFPYFLMFRVVPAEVIILGCFHGRRDPSVWKRRVDR